MSTKKTCIDCGATKDAQHFYRLRSGEPKRQSRCKTCDNLKRAGNVVKKGPGRIVAVRRTDGSIDLVRQR